MMKNRLAALVAATALAAPALAASPNFSAGPQSPRFGWDPRRIFGTSRPSKKQRREPSRLQLRGWHAIPCTAPAGYFWHQAAGGERRWYLLKEAPGVRKVVYDAHNDRSIIYSGWGYVKPTYAPGDVRRPA